MTREQHQSSREVEEIVKSKEKGKMIVIEDDEEVEDFIDVELNKDLRKMQNPSTEDAQNPIDLSFVPPTTNATPKQSRKRKHTTQVTTPLPPMLALREKFVADEDSIVIVQCRQLEKYCEDLIDQELKYSAEREKKLQEVIASENQYRTYGMGKSEAVIESVKVKEVEVDVFLASQASGVRCNARLGIVEEALILHKKICKPFLDVAKIDGEKMDALSASQVGEVPALEEAQPLAVSADPTVVEVPIDAGKSLLNPPNSALPPITEGDGTGA